MAENFQHLDQENFHSDGNVDGASTALQLSDKLNASVKANGRTYQSVPSTSTFALTTNQTALSHLIADAANNSSLAELAKDLQPDAVVVMNHPTNAKPTIFPPEFNDQPDAVTVMSQTTLAKTTSPSSAISEVKKKWMHEGLSKEFITFYNSHFCNDEKDEIAEHFLNQSLEQAGLRPNPSHHKLNIPAARMSLCLLAQLNSYQFKTEALDALLQLILKDEIEDRPGAGDQLMNLALELLNNMNRELFQTELVDVQIRIAKIYNALTELMQRQYAKGIINGLTKELRVQFIATANALQALNTQENTELSFHIKCALEGVYRLKDDRKELIDAIEKIFHTASAIASAATEDVDACTNRLVETFKGIDLHKKSSWYSYVLILHALKKEALNDPNKLAAIQIMVRDNKKKLNWKFTYAAMEALNDVCTDGATEQIRRKAFEGIKQLGLDFPGLASFADCTELDPYHEIFTRLVHFKSPRMKNPNIPLRKRCVEHLIELSKSDTDTLIQHKAKMILDKRLKLEKEPSILDVLNKK